MLPSLNPPPVLLERFLPPLADANDPGWLGLSLAPGNWILDPFGASPQLDVLLAKAGYRVLVTAGNPVARFLIDLVAHPPEASDLLAALGGLAAERKEDARLETHLKDLYKTRCDQCHQDVSAETFIWDKKANQPIYKVYHCQNCNTNGEFPATKEDIELAEQWARSEPLHRARALGRVADLDDPEREFAEEALSIYTPRTIYAIGTLINRLDALQMSPERRRCLMALLLHAFDACNALWPQQGERARPKSLQTPNLFRENNIWLALQQGLGLFQDAGKQAGGSPLVTLWPEEPPEGGGICIFEGPLRELSDQVQDVPIRAVLGAAPRPNQAFWTLSALWAGWLWGREAVGPFRAVLRRRRYDWQFQAEALRALMQNLTAMLPERPSYTCLVCEPEPSFHTVLILAGAAGGWAFAGGESVGGVDVLRWQGGLARKKRLSADVNFVRKALREKLLVEARPVPYLVLHRVALAALAGKQMISWSVNGVAELDRLVEQALESDEFVDVEQRASPVNGVWGLKKWQAKELFDG